MDNWDLDPAAEGDQVRASLFRVIRNAEPVALVPFNGWPRVLYRCRGKAKLESLRIYEAKRGTRKGGFKLLREAGEAKVFAIKVPEEGRYVICLQARGTQAKGEWPAVRVVVDGKVLSKFDAKTHYWWFYDTTARLGAGKHKVKVFLRNGWRDPATGEERFLYLNRLIIYRDPAEGRGEGEPPG